MKSKSIMGAALIFSSLLFTACSNAYDKYMNRLDKLAEGFRKAQTAEELKEAYKDYILYTYTGVEDREELHEILRNDNTLPEKKCQKERETFDLLVERAEELHLYLPKAERDIKSEAGIAIY